MTLLVVGHTTFLRLGLAVKQVFILFIFKVIRIKDYANLLLFLRISFFYLSFSFIMISDNYNRITV